MRTDIDSAVVSMLESVEGFKGNIRVTYTSARNLISSGSLVDTYEASFADDPGIPTAPTPQDACIIRGYMGHVYVDGSTMKMSHNFQAEWTPQYGGGDIEVRAYTRPAMVDGPTSGSDADESADFFVFYHENSTNNLVKLTVSKDMYGVGSSACVTNKETMLTFAYNMHLHAIDENTIYGLWIDDGGVRFSRITSSGSTWSIEHSPGRVMHHESYYEAGSSTDVVYLNYSAAAEFDDKHFVYMTFVDGNVLGMYYDTDTGAWSEVFEAVAQDLSIFAVANAFSYDDRIFLCGQFQRVDEEGSFDSPYVYSLLSQSRDGLTFSLDRNTLFAYGDEDASDKNARRFFTGFTETLDRRYDTPTPTTVYSSFGAWGASRARYDITPEQYDGEILGIGQLSGNYNDGWSINWHRKDIGKFEVINYGDGINIYLGVPDQQEVWHWFLLQECVYNSVSNINKPESTKTDARFLPWSSGKLEDMTNPFYVEIQGKQSIRDDCDEFDNLYKASEDGFLIAPLVADFWGGGEERKWWEISPQQDKEYVTQDLKQAYNLTAYPEIAELPITIKCYGWSRSGGATNLVTGGNTVPSNPNAVNARVAAKLIIERDNEEYTVVCGELFTSGSNATSNHFPRTWYTSGSGSYPVIIKGQLGLEVGDKIKSMAMVFTNENASDKLLASAERIEIPDVSMKIRTYEEAWTPVTATGVDKTVVILDDEHGLYYTENFDVDTPTWEDFNDGLDDAASLTHASYDKNRKCYYACGPTGVWRADTLGGTWSLKVEANDAVDKLKASGFYSGETCSGDKTEDFNPVWLSTWPLANGYIVLFGGGNAGSGCKHAKTLFLSRDGMATVDVAFNDFNPHGDTHLMGTTHQVAEVGGYLIATFQCGWPVGGDAHAAYSPDGGVNWYDMGIIYGWTTTGFAPFVGPDGYAYFYSSKSQRVSATSDLTTIEDTDDYRMNGWFSKPLPSIFDISGTELRNHQVVGTPKGGYRKVVAMCDDQTLAICDEWQAHATTGLPFPASWNYSNAAPGARQIAAVPSQVSSQAWISYGNDSVAGTYRVIYTEDDGETWQDKTGNLYSSFGTTRVVNVVAVHEGPPTNEQEADEGQKLHRIGIPVIYFSTRPYHTINAQVAAKYRIFGDDHFGGVLVCGHNGQNFIAARASENSVQLLKVRDGLQTQLAQVDHDWPVEAGWIQLTLHDGNFLVHTRDIYEADWGDPILTYEWTEADGSLLVEKDISHVGIYTMKDVPWFRITGLDLALGQRVGAMPLSTYWSEFPDSGQIYMEGLIYNYSGKITADGTVEGPFMGCHVGGPYNYTEDGHRFSGYVAEIHKYENMDISEHWDDYNNYAFACDYGFAWTIKGVDYSVWISTRGVPIPLRGRCRIFSANAQGDVVGNSTRTWLTHALTGLVLEDGDEQTHPAGTIAHLISEGEVILYEFCASGGHMPMIDERMIRKICGLASARPSFPGDKTHSLISLSGTPYQVS